MSEVLYPLFEKDAQTQTAHQITTCVYFNSLSINNVVLMPLNRPNAYNEELPNILAFER